MRKKIIAVTSAFITALSSISIVGFLMNLNQNYDVIKSTNECRQEIKDIHNNDVIILYDKIISEDGSKSLHDNAEYYEEILESCDDIEEKDDKVAGSLAEKNINDANMINYTVDSRTFIYSVRNVYSMFKEAADGDFSALNKLSDEESSMLVSTMGNNYSKLCQDYNELKLYR